MSFELNLHTESLQQAYPQEVLAIDLTTSTADVFEQLKSHKANAAAICDGGKLVGIFTERDALRAIAARTDLSQPISELMTREPTTLLNSDPVAKAISLMSEGGYRQVPIVDEEGKPVGMLKARGILHYLVEHFPKVIYNLPPEPHHAHKSREGA